MASTSHSKSTRRATVKAAAKVQSSGRAMRGLVKVAQPKMVQSRGTKPQDGPGHGIWRQACDHEKRGAEGGSHPASGTQNYNHPNRRIETRPQRVRPSKEAYCETSKRRDTKVKDLRGRKAYGPKDRGATPGHRKIGWERQADDKARRAEASEETRGPAARGEASGKAEEPDRSSDAAPNAGSGETDD